MASIHNNFRQRLLEKQLLVGTFQKTPAMMISEVLAKTNLDIVCLDAEHSPFDRKDIDACILAFRSEQKPSIVRPASGAPEQILNALDCGATGILVPHIDSVEKAKTLAKISRYGDGGRGYAGSTRAALYTGRNIEENIEHNKNENTVIAQIEDLAALEVIDEIAQVEGIDGLFIGMADLTVSLGCRSLKDEPVINAAKHICKAAKSANRAVGIFVGDMNDIPFWQEQGVSLFLLNSEHGFIKQGANTLLDNFK
ncbi:HpcH/HpaI aldolase family protein [Agarilytica rhodophyticola]|uniref:HpcH/HpaI aldolase family protein n=1 Tax=Agarilytica rhodophyticola TaxID=1737490 RepID=UPI000B349DF7|nr:aldolase/citrate lyase family protein [Agarilytica rhodophyticola]